MEERKEARAKKIDLRLAIIMLHEIPFKCKAVWLNWRFYDSILHISIFNAFREIGIWVQIASEMSNGVKSSTSITLLMRAFRASGTRLRRIHYKIRVNKLQHFWQCILTPFDVLAAHSSAFPNAIAHRPNVHTTETRSTCCSHNCWHKTRVGMRTNNWMYYFKKKREDKKNCLSSRITRHANSNEHLFTQLEFQFDFETRNELEILFCFRNSAIFKAVENGSVVCAARSDYILAHTRYLMWHYSPVWWSHSMFLDYKKMATRNNQRKKNWNPNRIEVLFAFARSKDNRQSRMPRYCWLNVFRCRSSAAENTALCVEVSCQKHRSFPLNAVIRGKR